MIGLTPRQAELLAYLREREISPTVREIMRALRWTSTLRVHEALGALEERGRITRLRDPQTGRCLARGIRLNELRLRVIFDAAYFDRQAALKRAFYGSARLIDRTSYATEKAEAA